MTLYPSIASFLRMGKKIKKKAEPPPKDVVSF